MSVRISIGSYTGVHTLCQPVGNQVLLYSSQKIPVERRINNEKEALLSTIPSGANVLPSVADLHPRWYPDDEPANVYYRDVHRDCDEDVARALAVDVDNSDTIDDNLEQKHNLKTPTKHWVSSVWMHERWGVCTYECQSRMQNSLGCVLAHADSQRDPARSKQSAPSRSSTDTRCELDFLRPLFGGGSAIERGERSST